MRPFFGQLVVSLVAHLLAARWVARAFPRLRPRILWGVCAVLSVFPALSRALAREYESHALALLNAACALELSVVVFSVVLLGIMQLGIFALPARWVGARGPARAAPSRAADEPRDAESAGEGAESDAEVALPADEAEIAKPATLSRRLVLERAAGVLAYGASASVLGWGMVRGRHDFRLEEVVVKVPGLSKKLDGYTLVQISDIHLGTLLGEDELDFGLDVVRRAKGDVLVATGDLMDASASFAGLLARKLRDIPFRDGVFGILGNHDQYAGGAAVRSGMGRGGVRILLNETEILRKDEGGIALVGVDDLSGPRFGSPGPLFASALDGVPREMPRILLSHQPDSIDWSPDGFALQLSGHTHGGQINPGFRPIDLVHRYVSGRYQVGATTLYVNRGFGVVGPPARVQAPPEVTRIVLVSA